MQKQQPDGKKDIIALACCDDEILFFRKGRLHTDAHDAAAFSEVSVCFFQYLKEGFQIGICIYAYQWDDLGGIIRESTRILTAEQR